MSHPKYRADIDGLRAAAVLAVVFFHAFPMWGRGGFAGVDVFFVISGFLISTILFGNLENNRFSLIEFYSRRVRRIFPSLFVVMLTIAVFGWFALMAIEYQQLGKHIAGGAGFISNLILWNEIGYFDNASETKPLLHLWSLGIEEQFYIFWPLIIWAAWKKRVHFLWVAVLLALVSFVLNMKGIRTNAIATFYSPQTRAWELLTGGVLAWISLHRKGWVAGSQWRSHLQSLLGLGLLMAGFVLISKETPFPGWRALFPTVGTVLLIAAGPQALVNRWILSNRTFVWFGLISYPLYLWHWPLLSLGQIVEGGTPARNYRLLAVAISVLLSWICYRFIEKPFRQPGNTRFKVTVLSISMTVLAGWGLLLWKQDGFPTRKANQFGLNGDQLVWNSNTNEACQKIFEMKEEQVFCLQLGNPENVTMAVLGDSTANALVPGLAEILNTQQAGVINLGQGSCPPVRGLTTTARWGFPGAPYAPNCPKLMERIYEYIVKNESIKTVVMSIYALDVINWGLPGVQIGASLEERFQVFKKLLDTDIQALEKHGKKVALIYDTPHLQFEPAACLKRPFSTHSLGDCSGEGLQKYESNPETEIFEKAYADRKSVCVIRIADLFMKDGKYPMEDETGTLIFRDNHHLSYNGSRIFGQKVKSHSCLY
jgi:peptidoglycan/LPS O-acetylase OafA/YrhL